MQLPVALFILIVLCSEVCRSQTLVWSDEFDGAVLDKSKWNVETGTGLNGDWGTGQQDAATDRPENVAIEQGVPGASGGVLRISTRKEHHLNRNYTSGRLNTQGKASWGPGYRIEARVWPKGVRYPGQGFAFWMMPQELPQGFDYLMWPQGGEIDIMEFSGMLPSVNLGSVHYAPSWNNNQWAANNHWHQGAYYSFGDQQVPLPAAQWITVDFGEPVTLGRVVLRWETAFAKSYQIQLSSEGSTWTDLATVNNGDGGVDDITVEGVGRYLRILTTERGTQWGYSLYELEAYRPADNANIALGKTVTSSSRETEALGPAMAVDGDLATRWASGDVESPLPSWPADESDPDSGVSGFRTYGIDWFSNRIEFHVDGIVYHIHYFSDGGAFLNDGQNQKNVVVINGRRVVKSEYSNQFPQWRPFEHKFFAILSAGVGGNGTYGGAIVPEAEFPCDVYVDWVRVYRLGDPVTSIEPEHNATAIGFPNPVSSHFYIPGVVDGTPVSVLDATGSEVMITVITSGTLDVSPLPDGVYFAKLTLDRKPITVRLIKH